MRIPLWLGLLVVPPIPAIIGSVVAYFQKDEWGLVLGVLAIAACYVLVVPALLLTILFLKRFSTPSFWRVVLLTPVTLLLLVIPLFNPLSAPTKLYNMFAGNEWPFGIAVLVWGLAAPAILCWITGIDRTLRGEMTLAQDVRHNKAGSGVGSAG